MTDAAAPIIVNGKHMANVFVGQFHLGEPDMEFFTSQAIEFGFSIDDYLQAVNSAPRINQTKLPMILGFMSGFARLISASSLARITANQAVQQLAKERLAALSIAEDNARMSRSKQELDS
jgi:two-component system sensor histidine kinase/response regulator